MPKKAIIFDLDDTLINTQRIKDESFALAARLGSSDKEISRTYEKLRRNLISIERIAQHLYIDQSVRKAYIRAYKEMLKPTSFYNFDGVELMLRNLRRRYYLILLTYGHKRFQKHKYLQSNLDKYFSELHITQDVTKRAALKRLRKKWGNNLLLVDDSITAVKTAMGLGIKAILAKKSFKDKKYYHQLNKRIAKKMQS